MLWPRQHIIPLIIGLLILGVSATAVAQDNVMSSTSDSVKDESAIILTPAKDWYYPAESPEWFSQAGTFYGSSGLGLEYLMRPPGSHFYGSIFASGKQGAGDISYALLGGLNFGYETVFYPTRRRGEVLRTDLDGTQLYLRIGPGFGFAGVARQDWEFKFHPGLYTTTAVGGLTKIGQRSALFLEMGGRLGWFPSLSEMQFIGGPQITIGFLIFSPQRIPVYQFLN